MLVIQNPEIREALKEISWRARTITDSEPFRLVPRPDRGTDAG